ncbi:hypothetical protein AN2V17_18580 [Vallitalea sp. AN17-2]|uniref:Uncharacterized protein n=2 Tax=Vallitalea maricola TaxID=3074433 RepID=A0ACB5UIP5_9FIRM|nr:hypothetical protein AN2V17_18580 [Vallitalea sp. AN17-2]
MNIPIYLVGVYFFTMLSILSLLLIMALCKILGYKSYNRNKSRNILIVLIFSFFLINCTFQYYAYANRNIDNLDIPFVNDNIAIGEWKSVDYTKDILSYEPTYEQINLPFEGLKLEPEGKIDNEPSINWTKGYILDHSHQTASKYIIRTIDNEQYLFMEWKSGDYIYRHQKPNYYVLKKVD